MPHDIFISHTHQDKLSANAACAVLEHRGIRCWIAPRDVVAGLDYSTQLTSAIADCRAMVIIFSGHTNESRHVKAEIRTAFDLGKILLPLRIQDIAPAKGMDHFLGDVHWLDAYTPPLESHLAHLADTLLRLLPDRAPAKTPVVAAPPVAAPRPVGAVGHPVSAASSPPAPREPAAKPAKKNLWLALAAVAAVAGLIGWGLSRISPGTPASVTRSNTNPPIAPAPIASQPAPPPASNTPSPVTVIDFLTAPGATITAQTGNAPPIKLGVADANGVLHFAQNLSEGNYTFTASKENYASAQLAGQKIEPTKTYHFDLKPTAVVAMPQAGKGWSIGLAGNVVLDLAWIAPGNFTMGSPADEVGRYGDEGPQTRVTLSKGFWLGKYDVTQGQYQALVGTNPSYFTKAGQDAPVEQVSWDDAVAFCQKLNAQERAAGRLPDGYAYTLPTEAQWEYACRAGTTGLYYAADLGAIAWYDANSGDTTHPVATKQPNAWGLYDMSGNVYQWCLDWYGKYPGGSVTDPVGSPSGSNRGLRGGSWGGDAAYCRSAGRGDDGVPGDRDFDVGFRLALSSVR
jgi:formylglycine-generating enzyme required for sulfatase activity